MFDAVDERLMAWIRVRHRRRGRCPSGCPPRTRGGTNPRSTPIYSKWSRSKVVRPSHDADERSRSGCGICCRAGIADPIQAAHRRLGELVLRGDSRSGHPRWSSKSKAPPLELCSESLRDRTASLDRGPVGGGRVSRRVRKEGPPVLVAARTCELIHTSPLQRDRGQPRKGTRCRTPKSRSRPRVYVRGRTASGAFRFAKVPARKRPRSLVVRVKGKERVFKLASDAVDGTPLRVELD